MMAALVGCGVKQVRVPILAGLTLEQIARGVGEKFDKFLIQAKINHPECSDDRPTAKLGICPALHGAINTQNYIVDATIAYCSGVPLAGDEPFGKDTNGDGKTGPCSPVLGAEPNLQGILANALAFMAAHPELGKSALPTPTPKEETNAN